MSCLVKSETGKFFIQSRFIKVFPCAGRSNTSGAIFDPEARLNTEKNAVSHVGLNGFDNTCILNWQSPITRFAIDGYTFEVNSESFEQELKDNHLNYAVIKLEEVKLNDGLGLASEAKTKMLGSLEDSQGAILDVTTIDGVLFVGLRLVSESDLDSVISSRPSDFRYIKLIEGENVNQEAFLPKFRHGAQNNTILLGEGTKAENKNQLSIGQYNTTATNALFVIGNGTSNEERSNALTVDNKGNVAAKGKLTCKSITETSDRRLKKNIKEFNFSTKSILDLPIYEYSFKDDLKEEKHIGFMAQDVQEVCPEIVKEDEQGFLSLQTSKLVYLLLKEVKDLKWEVEKLKKVK